MDPAHAALTVLAIAAEGLVLGWGTELFLRALHDFRGADGVE